MRYEVSDVRRKLAKDVTGFSAKAPRPEKSHVEKLTDQQRGIVVVQGDLVKFPHGDPWVKDIRKFFVCMRLRIAVYRSVLV
ncbi:MAG: hypothetical protein RLZZ283_26 [Candidatus Parcubacteria bacterium]